MAWKDIQKAHPTLSEAEAAFPAGQRCRVMEITMEGRLPLAERLQPSESPARLPLDRL